MALLQLQQRILTSAPIREMSHAPPNSFSNRGSPPDSLASSPYPTGFSSGIPSNGFVPNITPNRTSPGAHSRAFPNAHDGPSRAWTASSTGSDLQPAQTWATCTSENEPEKKGHGALSIHKLTIFKKSKPGRQSPRKSKEVMPLDNRLPKPPTNPSEDGYFDPRKGCSPNESSPPGGLSMHSVSTDGGSMTQPDGADVDNASLYSNPWSATVVPNPHNPRQISRNISVPSSIPPSLPKSISNPITSATQKANLPSEANKFAGFCQGAWRLQIGDRKKAMEERQRPGSMYNQQYFWKCKKCEFEGRLMKEGKEKVCDRTIMSADGVQFRWEFLFKCHLPAKTNGSNPLASTFGCIFCCAEGKGTPTFGGIQAFISHIQDHRDRLPEGEVLYRVGCVVGHTFGHGDDLDVSIMGRNAVTP